MNTTQTRVIAATIMMSAGVVVAILGYLGVSRELEVAFQLPYLASAGVGAIMLMGTGAALMISAQLQRDTDRLDELEEAVRILGSELGRLADLSEPADRIVDLRGFEGDIDLEGSPALAEDASA